MDQQLSSFVFDPELECVVVYAAKANDKDSPTLEVVGQYPKEILKNLGSIEDDPDLRAPSLNRRWYPLQEDTVLLGVLRAERRHSEEQWSDALDKRLQISATSLAHCLSLELDRQKLLEELTQHKDQIGILIHQLRNPLTALRTYAQLLLRKLDPESMTDVYNDIFLKKYVTALFKKQWGANLSKFNGVTMLGGVTLNGQQLYQEAQTDIQKLEEEIRSTYETPVTYMIG